MTHTNPQTAHRTLTSQHRTLRWLSRIGSVSVRKTNGCYVVRLENFETGLTTKKLFATLAGALDAADTLKAWYL